MIVVGITVTVIFCGGDTYNYQVPIASTNFDFVVKEAFKDFESREGEEAVKKYSWDISLPVSQFNQTKERVEIVVFVTCELFFENKEMQNSFIMQKYLLAEEDEFNKDKLKGETNVSGNSKLSSTPSTCEGCKKLQKTINQQQKAIDQQQKAIDQLQQDRAQQVEMNAQLQQSIRHLVAQHHYVMEHEVVPMQKIYRRVLLHQVREKICTILLKTPDRDQSWGQFLRGVLDSSEELQQLPNMDSEVILFVMTEANTAGLNNAAHQAERSDILDAVLAVQDGTRAMWIRLFSLIHGEMGVGF